MQSFVNLPTGSCSGGALLRKMEKAMTSSAETKDGVAREAASIPVLLTFDDGPHAGGGSGNLTRKVTAALKLNSTQNGIISVFFVQTHAQGSGGLLKHWPCGRYWHF